MDALNQSCFCTGLDAQRLGAAVDAPDVEALLRERCPHAFAARPVFVAGHDLDLDARITGRAFDDADRAAALAAARPQNLDSHD